MKYEEIARWLQHSEGCKANDYDYLDKTPCTCGLRNYFNPKSATIVNYEAQEDHSESYRDKQGRLREQGWTAYNSDYVDEFPTW